MVPNGNKAKCLSLVNHSTKTIHQQQQHHHHWTHAYILSCIWDTDCAVNIFQNSFLNTFFPEHTYLPPSVLLMKQKIRSVIKENTTRVVVACQNNILLLRCSKSHAMILWLVMSMKLSSGKKIAGLEIVTLNREKCSVSSNLKYWCLRSYTVYRDVLENR